MATVELRDVGDQVVGFAMISDVIPQETLAADPTLLGPYFLWRLLSAAPGQGIGTLRR